MITNEYLVNGQNLADLEHEPSWPLRCGILVDTCSVVTDTAGVGSAGRHASVMSECVE